MIQQKLDPPPTPADYNLAMLRDERGHNIQLTDEQAAVIRGELFPVVHRLGLSQRSLDLIAMTQAQNYTAEQTTETLQREWGESFASNLALVHGLIEATPGATALVSRLPSLSNSPVLARELLAIAKRRQGGK